MKKLLYTALAVLMAVGIFVVSCSKEFLEKEPPGALSESVLASPSGLEGLLTGAYGMIDGWAGWNIGSPWQSAVSNWVYGDVASDDAYKGSDVGDQADILDFEQYEIFPTNPYVSGKWRANYDGISRTNDVLRVLNRTKEDGNIDDDLATQIEAEAKFLRAFFHFELIKVFENVPFVDENAGDDGFLIPNPGPPYAQVTADLDFAVNALDVDPRNGQVGRATKYAAQALRGKVKLYQDDFSGALSDFNTIINSEKYSLVDNFHDNFRTSGDNNAESIFQYQASINDGSGEGANGNYGDILNFPYTGGPGACCGFHQPSQNLVNAYKTVNGLPMLDDFNAEDVKSDQGIGSDEPFEPYTGPLDPRLDWTVGRRGIPYLDWGPHPGRDWIRDQAFAGPYAPKKRVYYKAEEGSNSNAGGWGGGTTANNYNIIRYADVLLMAAECEIEGGSGGLEKAREYVNMIRERAKNEDYWVKKDDGSGNAANYSISTYDAAWTDAETARKAVRFERRLELAMEGHRFFDIRRYGSDFSYIKKTLSDYLATESKKRNYLQGVSFDDKDVRAPIPIVAIDLSKETLTQNPGY